MKIKKLTFLTSVILLTMQSFGLEETDHSNHSNHKHSEMIDTNKIIHLKNHENSEKIYVCPMHPEIMSDVAGGCPICGMKLEEIILEEE